MTDSNYQRWAELVDREAVGDHLSAEEETFCREFAEHNAVCQREIKFWIDLATVNEEPDEKTRSIVDGALSAIENESRGQERCEAEPPEIRLFKRNRIPYGWLFGGLAAVACALLLGVWQKGDRAQSPKPIVLIESSLPRVELVYASGQVQVNDRTVKVGDFLLEQGDTVEVLKGQACLAIDPGIDVCQGENSRLQLSQASENTRRLELFAGRVTAALAPLPKDMTFAVVAGEAVVTAVGTVFSVEVSDDRKGIETAVLAGKVSVKRRSDNRLVKAHQRAVVGESTSRVTPIVRADESQYWALVQNMTLWKGPATSILDLSGAPEGATVVLNGQPIGAAPLSSLIPAGSHRIELKFGDRTVLNRPFSSRAGQMALKSIDIKSAIRAWLSETGDYSAVAKESDEIKKVASSRNSGLLATNSPAGQLISVARRYMRQSRWEDAAFAYRELRQVYPHSPEAHTILVPLGQLELDHLRQPKAALKKFDLYLQQGGGSLSQEARFARIRAFRQLGQTDEEIRAIEEFLELYPSSFETRILNLRLESLTGEEQ
ncbi:MAG: FecR domain-containing protein [Deltaproteobacteria bacterium]|nr:FecR domain-containing protein [Deltaproteobacteria bacterium]